MVFSLQGGLAKICTDFTNFYITIIPTSTPRFIKISPLLPDYEGKLTEPIEIIISRIWLLKENVYRLYLF